MDPFLSHVCDWGLSSGVVSPTRGGGGGDGRGWWSGNSSARAGSTLVGPLCQPHLPLTGSHDPTPRLCSRPFGACYSPERSAVQAATIQSDPPPQRWHGGEEAAFSKNWTGATSHLKREASEPGTEKNKKKNDEAALEFACM